MLLFAASISPKWEQNILTQKQASTEQELIATTETITSKGIASDDI